MSKLELPLSSLSLACQLEERASSKARCKACCSMIDRGRMYHGFSRRIDGILQLHNYWRVRRVRRRGAALFQLRKSR